VAALRVHEHGVDDEWIALPLPPRPFRTAGHVGGFAPLEHDAFDSVGIGAGACRGRVFARSHQIVPCREGNERRETDAGLVEPSNELFEPPPAVGERQVAQILLAVSQQIVSAQVRGKFC